MLLNRKKTFNGNKTQKKKYKHIGKNNQITQKINFENWISNDAKHKKDRKKSMLTTDVRIYNDDGYMYRKCQFVFAFFYKLTSQGNCFSRKKFIFISKIRSFFLMFG